MVDSSKQTVMQETAMMTKPPDQSRRDMRQAILSACWGAIPQAMVKDSSLIIIFASLIGAGEMASVLSTGVLDLAGLLMLPFAALADRVGVKRQIIVAVWVSVAALLAASAAPWLGAAGGGVLLGMLALFAVAIAAYSAAWFPLLDEVVPPGERGLFFGRMRFAYQLLAALFLLAAGWFVGRYATVARLQLIIVVAALISLGRAVCIGSIQSTPKPSAPMGFRTAFLAAVRHKPLTGFGIYLFFLYLAASATMPVVFVFARNQLKLADNATVLLSVVGMGGLILGFPLGGRLVHRYGVKGVLLATHIGFALLNFGLLGVRTPGPGAVATLVVILAAYGVLTSCASVALSTELFNLAPPTNKAVSIALGWSLYSVGIGVSRTFASLLLGSGLLAESWQVGGWICTRHHSLFLAAGVGVLLSMLLLVFVPGIVDRDERTPAGLA